MNGFVAHMEFEDGWREPLIHRLDDHLKGVANLSGGFAESFGCRNWGYAAGLIHDIGKFSDEFQEYIHAVVVEKSKNPKYFRGSVDHTSAGAIYAATNKLHILDYLSAGHHSGLQDSKDKQNRLAKTECFESVKERAAQFFSENKIPPLENFMGMPIDKHSLNMLVRLMFSSLVDADYLDTEKFFFPDRCIRADGLRKKIERLRKSVDFPPRKSPVAFWLQGGCVVFAGWLQGRDSCCRSRGNIRSSGITISQ